MINHRHFFTAKRQNNKSLWMAVLLCLLPLSGTQASDALTRSTVTTLTSAASFPQANLQEQRQHYLAAREALRQGQLSRFKQIRQRLHGYPLTPYLDYYELSRRLRRLPFEEVSQFLEDNSDTQLGERLRRRWLSTLADKGRWQDFMGFYDADAVTYTALTCQALEARHRTGDSTALSHVTELWNVGNSQPDECDPLFGLWMQAGGLTQEVAWQRFNKAIEADNPSLARYIGKKLTSPYKSLADLTLEVYSNPHRIGQQQRFRDQTPEMKHIILLGLKRYARSNPLRALEEWNRYDAQQLFDDDQRLQIQQQLAIRLVYKDLPEKAEELLSSAPRFNDSYVTELMIREALKQQDWVKVSHFISRLPADTQQEERWLYWHARALEEQEAKQQPKEKDLAEGEIRSRDLYTQLAMQRSFYAFLAADRLGRQYQLVDSPASPPKDVLLSIANNPASVRARELLAVKDNLNATREWLHLSKRFQSEDEHIAAAKLANQWGWHQKGIISMASAKYWDDLRVRFPLAYNKQFLQAAQKNQVSPLLLFAIARQESAFSASAHSPAGARGLMQLMPGTAKQTARKAGVRYQLSDLYQPEKNIHLGSAYITELLDEFNGNRILATAAYNAGPHRVKRWLSETRQQLPADIWIEVIPFKETRKYVQNVLAYQVIYGYRTGTTPAMLSPDELQETL